MENLTDKLKKHAVKILLPIAILSQLIIGNSIKKYESGCEIFQGHTTLPDDGRIVYIFDPKTETERVSTAPKYRICGNPSLTDSLKIGKLYRFTTIKRSLPWSKRYIECIIP